MLARVLDLKFVDLPGQWQHFSVPVNMFDEDTFAEGFGFDGSSIRGFQTIQESDMLLSPIRRPPSSTRSSNVPTLSLICNVNDPITASCTRAIRATWPSKAEAYLKGTGIADTCFFGPEAEFFIFDDARFDQTEQRLLLHRLDEGRLEHAASDEKPNLGYQPRYKEGYFPVPPPDTLQDLRTEMMLISIACRHRRRDAPPRSRHRRPVRDRHAVRRAHRRWPTA